MNRTKLKNYAPQARRDFIQAMTDRAAYYGLTAKKTEPVVEKGDVAVIGGRSFPIAVAKKRKALEDRIQRHGFEQTMEAMAYTWFNRLVAIRFMELHGYLDHGYRVLSPAKTTTDNTDGTDKNSNSASSVSSVKSVVQIPEILLHAEHVELPGLKKDAVIDLKLAGNKEGELYRLLLTAQCNALHTAMPFLFERIDDETELLLPDNLLNSDSLMRKLVGEIEEEDWNEVEIIGWLYQFYISDKKDEVIGKVVASEDIPAATQLFTPNWIVKYLVQNTLGRLWIEHHPNSPLKAKMEYYIEPAEQTPEVQAQLQEIIRQRAIENRSLTTDNTDSTDEKYKSVSSLSVPSVLSVVDLSLNPENLTLLDPACGSGHILVEAYDLFKAIYQERGYRAKDIPALILQKNLFGLEIDDRAAQLAAFALLMKARADDRQLFTKPMSGKALAAGVSDGTQHTPPAASALPLTASIQPHVMALVETQDMDTAEIAAAVSGQWGAGRREEPAPPPGHLFEKDDNLFTRAAVSTTVEGSRSQSRQRLGVAKTPTQSLATLATPTSDDGPLTADIRQLIDLFAEARTFGSLIQVPSELAARLPLLEQRVHEAAAKGELSRLVALKFQPVVEQARLLAKQYDCVVANPPYMGSKYQSAEMKSFVSHHSPACKPDIFAAFIRRSMRFGGESSTLGFVVPYVWMFLNSYEQLRSSLLEDAAITSLTQLEYNAFEPACVPVCSFTLSKPLIQSWRGAFIRLSEFKGHQNQAPRTLEAIQNRDCGWFYTARQSDFRSIPGQPIAYWVSDRLRQCFHDGTPLGEIANPCKGMDTGDNSRFLRMWPEIASSRIGLRIPRVEVAVESRKRWFPYSKGGEYRRWFGNNWWLVDWENGGERIRAFLPRSTIRNSHTHFNECVTWTDLSSAFLGCRRADTGFLHDNSGPSAFPSDQWRAITLSFLCSSVAMQMLRVLNPTMHFQIGNIASLPMLAKRVLDRKAAIEQLADEAVSISRQDWDSFETSWDFQTLPVLRDQGADAPRSAGRTLAQSQAAADVEYLARFQRMKQLEEENNRLFIDAYGLQDELSPAVPDDQITLYRPDREQDIQRLISYALGCLMGRYSLDQPGLIYANSGNVGFDPGQYRTFPADPDGIVPLTETDWFPDDAAHRFIEFLSVAWPGNSTTDNTESTDQKKKDDQETESALSVSSVLSVVKSSSHLEDNLKFVAECLGPTKGESPRETLRRSLATGFYKHHLQTYKRRPIYWLFSSGKQRAFQCLVYLHRYHEGTLARMRTEYVIPLQGQIAGRIEQLEGDKAKATSTSHRKKLQKEQDDLKKQQTELLTFEEKLKHAADQKISLDLDDGVKVNYAKFGDLLAESKAITGGKDEE